MRIAFYNTKPYDRIWFEMIAKDEGFETEYIEEAIDEDTVSLAEGYDAVSVYSDMEGCCKTVTDNECLSNENRIRDNITDKIIRILYEEGIRAILLRNEKIDKSKLLGINRYGMSVYAVPAYSPRKAGRQALGILPSVTLFLLPFK
ncbi:MAG: hypothetical protein IJV15_06560 [Lachnospiraceae bacterium]|nr:hypothetical protein [Lachnospiraceae bacterium]